MLHPSFDKSWIQWIIVNPSKQGLLWSPHILKNSGGHGKDLHTSVLSPGSVDLEETLPMDRVAFCVLSEWRPCRVSELPNANDRNLSWNTSRLLGRFDWRRFLFGTTREADNIIYVYRVLSHFGTGWNRNICWKTLQKWTILAITRNPPSLSSPS